MDRRRVVACMIRPDRTELCFSAYILFGHVPFGTSGRDCCVPSYLAFTEEKQIVDGSKVVENLNVAKHNRPDRFGVHHGGYLSGRPGRSRAVFWFTSFW